MKSGGKESEGEGRNQKSRGNEREESDGEDPDEDMIGSPGDEKEEHDPCGSFRRRGRT